jgi:very-short-patch-repair endonuclease
MKFNPHAEVFKYLLNDLKIEYVQEYKFHPTRKFRFDFAILDKNIAFEIDGQVFKQGRHTRGVGYCNDCVKQWLADELGWRMLRIPTNWLDHNLQKKPQAHLVPYELLKARIKELIR